MRSRRLRRGLTQRHTSLTGTSAGAECTRFRLNGTEDGVADLALLNGCKRTHRHLFGGSEIDSGEIQLFQPDHDLCTQQFLAYAMSHLPEHFIVRLYLLYDQTCGAYASGVAFNGFGIGHTANPCQ